MAASFWESSQSRCWTFTKEELEQMRDALQEEDQALAQMFPLPDWKHINIFLNMRKAGPCSSNPRLCHDGWAWLTCCRPQRSTASPSA